MHSLCLEFPLYPLFKISVNFDCFIIFVVAAKFRNMLCVLNTKNKLQKLIFGIFFE